MGTKRVKRTKPSSRRRTAATASNPHTAVLSQNVGLLEGLFEHAPVAYALFTPEGACLLTNPAYRMLFGAVPPPEYRVLEDELAAQAGITPLFLRAVAGESVQTPPFWYDPRQLRHIQVEKANRVAIALTFFPVRGRDGGVEAVAAAYRDLTAELTAREELEAERARLHRILMEAPAFIALTEGPEHRYALSNPLNTLVTGGRAEVGKRVRDVVPEFAAQGLTDLLDRVYTKGETVSFEEQPILVEPPGAPSQQWWIKSVYQPTRDASGDIDGVALFAFDVTEQVKARQRIEESEARFRSLVQATTLAVWRTDPAGRVVEDSPSWRALTGQSLAQFQGAGWLDAVHPDDRTRTAESWRAAVLSKSTYETEYRLRGPDGRYRWMLVRGAPVLDARGEVQEWVGTNADMSALKQAEEELRQTATFREQFIGILGHDLRGPLSAVKASTDLLFKYGELTEPQRRAVQRIASSSDRMARMIGDLLDFARGRLGGGIPLDRGPMDLSELARQVVDELSAASADRRIELSCTGPCWGEWDFDRLAQVVTNLVVNALDHGGAESPVGVAVRGEPSEVRLEVHNGGSPIPPERVESLFEPFHGAGERRRGSGGLGLGLYIVSEVVKAHGGAVTVRSSPEEDTTFRVTLPRAAGVAVPKR